jgi:tetratricopeptide (TPR) repeat protein
MYYEHRNYLPGLLLFLPVVTGLVNHTKRLTGRITLAFLMLAIPAALTSVRAEMWSNDESIAYHWAEIHPKSQRALRHAALVAEGHGKYDKALNYIYKAKQGLPDNIAVELHWLTLNCRVRPINESDKDNAIRVMEQGYFSFRSYRLLKSSIQFIASEQCLGTDRDYAYRLIDSLRTNPYALKLKGARYQLYMVEGKLLLQEDRFSEAAEKFRLSLQELPDVDGAFVQVGLLASAGQYQLALNHLNFIESNVDTRRKKGKLDYNAELSRLKSVIREDLE